MKNTTYLKQQEPEYSVIFQTLKICFTICYIGINVGEQ